MKTPLVSIIIPTYNRSHLIAETLDSVLAQTYTNWECIVVDDGSTDETDKLLEEYCKKDSRFQYHHRPTDRPKGANACRNYGFELSKGEYINWLDSDDLFSKNKIEEQIKGLIKNGGDIATCKWGRFDEDIYNADIKKNEIYYRNYSRVVELFNDFAVNGGYFPIHSYLINRKLTIIGGNWNETLLINQDGEYISRILAHCNRIIYLENSEVFYRRNSSESSTSSYDSIIKLKNLILSWKLIESNLKTLFKKKRNFYVKNAKRRIFVHIKNQYPFFVFKNFYFFTDSIINFYLKKIINRFNLNLFK